MTYHPNEVARRGRFATFAVLVLFVALGSRFFSIQILRHAEYALRSDRNRLNEVPLPAARGIIYDRKGQIIAENVPGYTVSILASRRDSLQAMLERVSRRVPLSRQQIEAAIRRQRDAGGRPTLVLPAATFETVAALEEHRADFPSLIIQSSPMRYYPDSNAVAAFSGYTREVTEDDLAADSTRVYKSGQQVGKQGLEMQYESVLRGAEGSRFVEVDAYGRVVRNGGVRAELAPIAGQPLRTNIDMDVQRAIARYFGDSLVGAAVVLEPKTGAVVALFSNPAVNPNKFIGVVTPEYYKSLLDDPREPMVNKAIQGRYPPGSTWKLATAVMALEQGKVTMDQTMPHACDGGYVLGSGGGARRFKCWIKTGGHGNVDLRGAISQSCDVFFYQLGQRISFSGLVAGGRKLGFGTSTDIDLPSEKISDFPPLDTTFTRRDKPDSLAKRLNAYYDRKFPGGRWSQASETLNLSIGQGSNSETVVSMARFYTALATNGYMARPHIVGDSVMRTKIFTLTDEQMADVRQAMVGVTSGGGTAAASAIKGVAFAGKTGSAQNAADRNKDHGWFVGFAPADDPKVVVAVFLEFGLHGSRAAHVAKAIVEAYLKTAVADAMVTGD